MKPSVFRLGSFSAAAALALALGACNNSTHPGLLPHPPPASPIAYTAIGASDAVGIGASIPCGTLTAVPPTCPTGTGYVPVIARTLSTAGFTVTLDDLGISGAVLGPDILAQGNAYSGTLCSAGSAYPADFITAEVPLIPSATNDVTIFAGGNDTNALTNALVCQVTLGTIPPSGEAAYIATWITNFGNDYATLIADVKKVNPKARIVAMNLPNFALIPVGTTQPAAVQAALTQFSVGFDVNVINKLAAGGIPVIDLLCDPRSYLASNFSADGFHPNDAGYAIIASEMEPALVTGIAPAPATSCSQMAAPAGATGKLLNGSERFVPPKP